MVKRKFCSQTVWRQGVCSDRRQQLQPMATACLRRSELHFPNNRQLCLVKWRLFGDLFAKATSHASRHVLAYGIFISSAGFALGSREEKKQKIYVGETGSPYPDQTFFFSFASHITCTSYMRFFTTVHVKMHMPNGFAMNLA
ncbi:hypothetical protein T4E_1602 [Trichinella pseudospiralis]|uniref:Uncharacterized protein n=1 Tax=Trichinella pseudospiralis TaxID=6337 RepID=A0A0V0YH23_TRIPS|nr:hypothetical protein T4E_1602 [Trichinella pseudospiralis]